MLIFITSIAVSGWTLSTILEGNAENNITSKALILLQTMNAVRDYTNTEITPELNARLDTEEQFLPQTVPAFSAREVFEKFRSAKEYSNFFYKEATINPTNPRDKADEFESQIVASFRNQPSVKQVTGFRFFPGGDLFYVARPLAITQESCLRCHSTPEAAPKSQINTYGKDNGFGWKLNDIITAQIISVPASAVLNSARQSLSLVMAILIGILAVGILLVNFLLRRTVINPLKQMSHTAKEVSTGNMDAEFEHKSSDEIGILAASFNRMKVSLQMALNMLNQGNNSQF